jgi:hypothetical protein
MNSMAGDNTMLIATVGALELRRVRRMRKVFGRHACCEMHSMCRTDVQKAVAEMMETPDGHVSTETMREILDRTARLFDVPVPKEREGGVYAVGGQAPSSGARLVSEGVVAFRVDGARKPPGGQVGGAAAGVEAEADADEGVRRAKRPRFADPMRSVRHSVAFGGSGAF